MRAKTQIKGMTWSDPRGYDPLVAASAAFRARYPDTEITWDRRSLQGFESTPVDVLARNYDLLIIDHPHVGAVVQENCLLPLDRLLPEDTLLQLSAQTVGKSFQSYLYKGHQWAVPVDAACQVQAMRPDLMERPVDTIAQVIKLAEGGKVLWPLRPPHVLMSFFTILANLGAAFPVVKSDKIDPNTAQKAFNVMQILYDQVDPACRDMDPIDALNTLSEGSQFALCPLTYLYAPYGSEGYRSHQIAFHDMPSFGTSGPLGSALGGTGLAISAQTQHPKICAEFTAWVAGAEVQKGLYTDHNGQPGNAVAWGDAGVNAPVGNAYAQTRMTHEAAWLRPRHAGYMGFQEEGSHILLDALKGQIPHAAALSALQSRFHESFPDD